ncbi:competence type IV pilus ATPase ComGA [Ligilactobacillus sp.]|uniref:competence type IV pilus ATPase ComGA n=1 Tax=Ligilactobacillus sp. TaxID=2767921 RepID=UPI002FE23088
MDGVLQKILTDAMDKKASDISFLPQENSYLVKFCVAGRFEAYDEFDFGRAGQWIGFLKYRADMSLAEQRRPQLGSWKLEHNGRPVYCRLSTVGDFLNRESLVMRLIYQDELQEEKNCFFTDQWDRLSASCRKRGLILFSGPMGSGKTTTMYELARKMTDKQIMCIEDPVEISEPHFLQVQVNEKAGMSYSDLLKVALRHHPDVFIIGEIRDGLTAKTAVNAALSGHLVLSTVHAASVYGIWQRMINLGISSEELEQTMRLASYQRLIPRENGGSSVLFDFLDIDELEESIRENSGRNRQMTKEWGKRLGICVETGEISEETAVRFLQG